MSIPLISVILVVRDGAATVRRLVDSVVSQRSPEIEFIVVDGVSTDGTLEILLEYGTQIDQLISEPDRGIYDAFNKAVAIAKGAYYVVAGADDYFYPRVFAQLLSTGVFDATPDFVVCNVRSDGRVKSGLRPHLGWIRYNLIVSSHSLGMFIRRSVHDKIGMYPTRYRVLADGVVIKALAYGPFKGATCAIEMGEFSPSGASGNNYSDVMWEHFLIQLRTERWKLLQVLIFFVRLLKNLPSLIRYNER